MSDKDELERLRRRVTQLERSETQQRRAREDLQRRVEERADDLRCADARVQSEVAERHRVEERFRNIFAYSNDAILLLDPDQDEILDANPRACRLLDYTYDEFRNLPVGSLFPEHMARLQAFALSVVEQGYGWIDEISCQTRTGQRREVELSASEISYDHQRNCVLALMRDITDRKRAESQILASLQEKEVLLREIHHRVKNNLQVISSLFDLQAPHTHDAHVQSMLRECRNRVRTMAAIHEALYRDGDLARIDFARYVTDLGNQLVRSFGVGDRVQLEVQIDNIRLDVDQAIPCGLIVNELITNALKHAFPEPRQGRICVSLARLESQATTLCLQVSDDGLGLPEALDVGHATSLGLRLVRSLVGQLGGQMAAPAPKQGTQWTIDFGDTQNS